MYYSWGAVLSYSWGRKGKVCITPGLGRAWPGGRGVYYSWGGEVWITPGPGEARCVLLPGWEGPPWGQERCVLHGARKRVRCVLLPGGRCVLLLGQESPGVYYSRGGRGLRSVLLLGGRGVYSAWLKGEGGVYYSWGGGVYDSWGGRGLVCIIPGRGEA